MCSFFLSKGHEAYLVILYGLIVSFSLIMQMCFNAFDKAADLDVLEHPILNFIYYLVSSISLNFC